MSVLADTRSEFDVRFSKCAAFIVAPMALIFLGVIGGMLAFGFLGLFIGPTLLTVAFNLVQEWMGRVEEA